MLTKLILKLFVPGINEKLTVQNRTRCGIVCGITGIVCNILLAVVKIILAVITGSIAIAADAVNNLSDAASSGIAVAGFRLSSRPPDADHPFGHGRTEYVAGLITALLIVGLGVTFLKDSIVQLFRPSETAATAVTIVIFGCTMLVKCWLFFFSRKVGTLINSDVIKAAAFDSLGDCLATSAVVVSLIASHYTAFPVDGCAGIIVALMILWAGTSVLKDTVSKLLGEPPDETLVSDLREILLSCPGIDGIHDIMIHNYGENSYYVTAHAEISSIGDRFSAHDILENAEVAVGSKLPVHLLLHGDPYNKENPEVIYWRSRMENEVANFDSEFKLYDFRIHKADDGKVEKLSFHLLVPHHCAVSEAEICEILQQKMSGYNSDLRLDIRILRSFIR